MKNVVNHVAIDPSLASTAVCINGELLLFANNTSSTTKTGKLKLWHKRISEVVPVFIHDSGPVSSYSDREINNLMLYKTISENIASEIQKRCKGDTVSITMEGYSYSSNTGPLIDLVTFGTLLRHTLVTSIPNITLNIIPPTAVKSAVCMLMYPENIQQKGKKTICENNSGVKGGAFKKEEMLQAIYDAEGVCDGVWRDLLLEYREEIESYKKVPKPIDDLNDAFLIYHISKQ